MSQNTKEIEQKVKAVRNFSDISFIYELLIAYGKPKSSITRLQTGTYNIAKNPNEIYWKNNLLFKHLATDDVNDLLIEIDKLSHDKAKLTHNPRFIIVTNLHQLLAVNTKDNSRLDIPINKIGKHYAFFLPWAGMEKSILTTENEADVKAAGRMALLYDEIIANNPKYGHDTEYIHSLNIFFSRLLFCFFAEDTQIFAKKIFTDTIEQHTQVDGNDLDDLLKDIFKILDKNDEDQARVDLASHLAIFPYVNGKLFEKTLKIPKFSPRARKLLIECGKLNWSHINPDIFGSMIQAVVHPGDRASLGMHYTSVVNIMKVINPLFVEDLNNEFEKYKDNKDKLWKLHKRITNIKIFDPACGSGNFLIISYKELRKLENKILNEILTNGGKIVPSQIKLENFYGIEIDDFAHEIATLSLWLAKHQMNIEYDAKFGTTSQLIPLKDVGSIRHGNAARLDWNEVCPNVPHITNSSKRSPEQTKLIADEQIQTKLIDDSDLEEKVYDEIYVIGNPPYLGCKSQTNLQKEELGLAFRNKGNYKELDYIALWFIKAAEYLTKNIKCSFVSTSSINQGSQVEQLWPRIFKNGIEISFAYLPFNWTNNAKANAGVSCTIIGMRKIDNSPKYIYSNNSKISVKNINAYLLDGPSIFISKATKPISKIPPIITGNSPYDGTRLLLSDQERAEILADDPKAYKFIRQAMGASELMNNVKRWCIWINKDNVQEAIKINKIKVRIDEVRTYRKNGGDVARGLADTPYSFRYTHTAQKSQIIIPIVSSGTRRYLPVDLLDERAIIIGSASAIYDPEPYVFGVLSSLMHFTWVKATAGRLRQDIRYLSALCYNTFPFPNITEKQKDAIAYHAFEILETREKHSEEKLSYLYGVDTMPPDLLAAHHNLDDVIDLCYRTKPFTSDEERLSYLFKEYEKMLAIEKESQ